MKKTFKDIEFKNREFGMGLISRTPFDNGWALSVAQIPYTDSGKRGLYELAVINKDGHIDYDNPVSNGDIVSYLNEEEVTELMLKVQEFS